MGSVRLVINFICKLNYIASKSSLRSYKKKKNDISFLNYPDRVPHSYNGSRIILSGVEKTQLFVIRLSASGLIKIIFRFKMLANSPVLLIAQRVGLIIARVVVIIF